jgi:hypothetical protein
MSDKANSDFISVFEQAKRGAFLLVCDRIQALKRTTDFGRSEKTKQISAQFFEKFRDELRKELDSTIDEAAKLCGVSSSLVKFECQTFHDELAALIDKLMDRDATAKRAEAIRAAQTKKKT